MKNPFKKNKSNGLLIAGIIGGAVAAAIVTSLIIRHRHELANAAEDAKDKATAYLDKAVNQVKKHKTDVENLKEIIPQNS